MKIRCESCRYRGTLHTSLGGKSDGCSCDYIIATGKSRVDQVYKRLGVTTLTEEAERMLEPANCPFFDDGEREERNKPQLRRAWDKEKALALWKEGRTDKEIAEAVGTRPATVSQWRLRHGYVRKREKENVWRSAPDLRRMVEAGMTDTEIAARLGIGRAAAAWRRSKLGIPPARQHVKIDREKLRSLVKQGLSDSEIAARLGASAQGVGRCRREIMGKEKAK